MFAYLYTCGCCHLQSSPLVKPCTFLDDCATAANISGIHFLERYVVSLSRSAGISGMSSNLCSFLIILETAKSCRVPSQRNKVVGQVLELISGPGTCEHLAHHEQDHCRGGESTCQEEIPLNFSEFPTMLIDYWLLIPCFIVDAFPPFFKPSMPFKNS